MNKILKYTLIMQKYAKVVKYIGYEQLWNKLIRIFLPTNKNMKMPQIVCLHISYL